MHSASDHIEELTYRVVSGPHIDISDLWRCSDNLASATPSVREHLSVCQDCISVVWLCRGLGSIDKVRMKIRDHSLKIKAAEAILLGSAGLDLLKKALRRSEEIERLLGYIQGRLQNIP